MKIDFIEYLNKFGVDMMFAHYMNNPKSFVDDKHDFNFIENYVINSGNANWIFEFAHMIKKADKNKMQTALINLQSGRNKGSCLLLFARYIKGANVLQLQDALIKTNDYSSIFQFAKFIKTADIQKLQSVILKSGDASLLYFFARDIKGADIEKLQNAIIKTNDVEFIFHFAKLKGVNVKKLEDVIIKSNNLDYILYFATFVKGANKERLFKILETKCKK